MASGDSAPVELESQIILRLPPAVAKMLRDALRNNPATVKDRLKIKLEPDMRHGTLYFDNLVLAAKLVDLPCIIESHKTIDNKHIYKTADIAQMLICSEDAEPEEETKPEKKKESLKVDKKYLYPHGITPPLKNVRKRRFRKTLKKKQYSDQPELEKEVRRLLRTDYEAHEITWEVIDEEEQSTNDTGVKDVLMQGSKTNEEPTPSTSSQNRSAVEHIFGEDLSDSDLEDEMRTSTNMDEESRLSMESEESRSQSDSFASFSQETKDNSKKSSQYVTSFSGDMFSPQPSTRSPERVAQSSRSSGSRRSHGHKDYSAMSKGELKDELYKLKAQLTELSVKCQIQETELKTIENVGLKQRLASVLDKMLSDQKEKEKEIQLVENILEDL